MGLFGRRKKSNKNSVYGKNYPELWKSAVKRNDPKSLDIFIEWMNCPAAKTDSLAILAQIIYRTKTGYPKSDISLLIDTVKLSKPSDDSLILFYTRATASCLYAFDYVDLAEDLRPAVDIAVGGIDKYIEKDKYEDASRFYEYAFF